MTLATIDRIPPMSKDDVDRVQALEDAFRPLPQIDIETSHVIHAGVYARTIMIPAGAAITGAYIKRTTSLIVSGHCTVYVGGRSMELCGYHVLPASAGRKQAFFAHADTYLTMVFGTSAQTVEEAEVEFTDDYAILLSRSQSNHQIITGE
jgi:hypothetical protein